MNFDSDSSLSDAPSLSASPARSLVEAAPRPKPKKPTRKSSTQASTEGSRRSSRVATSRSTSPTKSSVPPEIPSPPASAGPSIKIKIKRPKAEAVEPIPEEPVDDPPSKKRKTSLAKGRADDEVRAKAGTKKAKTSHPNRDGPVVENQVVPTPVEPVKKGTAVKRKGKGRDVNVDLDDLFGDDEDEIDQPPEAGPSTIATPTLEPTRSKAKKGTKANRPDIDPRAATEASVEGAGTKASVRAGKKSRVPAASTEETMSAEPIEQAAAQVPASSKRKGKARGAALDDEQAAVQTPSETTQQPIDSSSAPTKKKKDKKSVRGDDPATTKTNTDEQDITMKDEPVETAPPTEGQEASSVPTAKRSKTFAQAVSGSPAPPTQPEAETLAQPSQPKKEKRNLSAIPKIAKLASTSSPLSTPQSTDKKPPIPGPSTSVKKATPAPPPKKPVQAPSLLESTLATLQAAQAGSSTPKKEETKSTPKPAKVYAKGEWTDEWILSATEQREVYESRAEREAARARRMEWRKNPVNLQEAKDAYRLDSTVARVIPPLTNMSGLSIKTEGAPSQMVAALLGLPGPEQTA